MEGEQLDNDIVEMDLPDYAEYDHAIPDVEPEASFAENKEEIYRRNRLLAADMQAKELAVIAKEEKAIAVKAAALDAVYREKAAAEYYSRGIKYIFSALAVLLVTVLAVLAVLLIIQTFGSRESGSLITDLEELDVDLGTLYEAVASSAAEVSGEKAEVPEIAEEAEEAAEEAEEAEEELPEDSEEESAAYSLSDAAVREPFENDGSALICNTEIMSYRFEPHYKLNRLGEPELVIYTSVKNLTDDEYFVIPNFIVRWGFSHEYIPQKLIYAEDNNVSDLSDIVHEFYPEEPWSGEWVRTSDYPFNAYEFGSDHTCNFEITFFDYDEFDLFENFIYAPSDLISREYLGKVDMDFLIPFEDIRKYIIED